MSIIKRVMADLLISGFYNKDFRLRIFRGVIYAEFWWGYGYLLGVRGFRGSATKILKKIENFPCYTS